MGISDHSFRWMLNFVPAVIFQISLLSLLFWAGQLLQCGTLPDEARSKEPTVFVLCDRSRRFLCGNTKEVIRLHSNDAAQFSDVIHVQCEVSSFSDTSLGQKQIPDLNFSGICRQVSGGQFKLKVKIVRGVFVHIQTHTHI